ncbi:26S proteasome regulatory subunit 8 homolog B-like protein [Tanacetum coccineum]
MVSGIGSGDGEVQRTMTELLNQLDGFEASNKIKVLMATNRIDILDKNLLTPGRIDRKIEFPNPNENVHAYGRSNGVYNYTLDSCSPVHITTGDGGNRENMVVEHAESTTSDSFNGGLCAYNFTSVPAKGGFCWDWHQ